MTTTQHQPTTSPTRTDSTRRLLVGGAVAGPLFVTTAASQVLTRDGFDLSRHFLSQLSLGAGGWVQIANFVLTGVLVLGLAVGMRQIIGGQRGGTWAPRLVGAFGVGLVVGGVFLTDPANGFPLGAAAPLAPSWHAIVHDVGPALALDGLSVATFVLARRFAAVRARGWAGGSIATGIVLLGLLSNPTVPYFSAWLAVGVTLAFGYTSALAIRMVREHDDR